MGDRKPLWTQRLVEFLALIQNMQRLGSSYDTPSHFDASFLFDRIEPDAIGGNALEYGEVVCEGLGAAPHSLVVEGPIPDPVQSVLNFPVAASKSAAVPCSINWRVSQQLH